MINVKNLLYQPLTLNLAVSKRTLYMRPREIHSINKEEVSKEVMSAQKRGLVQLTYLTKPSKVSSKPKSDLPRIGKSKPKKGK